MPGPPPELRRGRGLNNRASGDLGEEMARRYHLRLKEVTRGMSKVRHEHVSERFVRLLTLYRKPSGGEWGGQDLERATNGVVTRSYISNLRRGRIDSPGLDKLAAIAKAMDFPPQLWFGEELGDRTSDVTLVTALEDSTIRKILGEVLKLELRVELRDRQLLLGIARQIRSHSGPKGR